MEKLHESPAAIEQWMVDRPVSGLMSGRSFGPAGRLPTLILRSGYWTG